MKTIRRSSAALLLVLLFQGLAIAQNTVNVNIVLKPPYSSYIKDYQKLEGKAVLTVTNLTSAQQQIYLKGSLSNESIGLYVRSDNNYKPSSPLLLGPNQTRVITADANSMRFLDEGNAETNAGDNLKRNILRSGQLPEGLYKICVRAFDYNSSAPLSDENAGCAMANITQAGPPQITFPLADMEIPEEQKIINFAWTPPVGNLAGGKITYQLVVVEIQPGQNPNDAVRAARDFGANNPVIQRKNIMTQSYTRQPYDLEIKPGKKYAIQVVATDANGKLLILNNGQSEVVVFNTGLKKKTQITYTPTATTGKTGYLPLFYQDPAPSPLFILPSVTGKLKYYYGTTGTGKASPLANIPVKLILCYQLMSPTGSVNKLWPNNVISEDYEELAVATTASDGSFYFPVPNIDKINFTTSQVPKEFKYGQGEFKDSYTGKFRRVLKVMVEDKYYSMPDEVGTCSGKLCDIGTFYSRVKDMSLTVNVRNQLDNTNQSGIEVLLLRYKRPTSVPADEVTPGTTTHSPVTIKGVTYQVLKKEMTQSNGNCTFENLVQFDKDNVNDRYFIAGKVDEDNTKYSLLAINPQAVLYKTEGSYNSQQGGVALTPSSLAISYEPSSKYNKPGLYNRMTTLPTDPRIYGIAKNPSAGVSNSTNNQGEGQVTLRLFRLDAAAQNMMKKSIGPNWAADLAKEDGGLLSLAYNGDLEAEIKTPNSGEFDFRNLKCQWSFGKQIGYYRLMVAEKNGFYQVIRPIKQKPAGSDGDLDFIKYGEAFNMGDVIMMPAGGMKIRLVNEDGEMIKGKAYYYDALAAQVGEVKKSENKGIISMSTPTGNIKVVVIPDDMEQYMRDTVSLVAKDFFKILFSEPTDVQIYYRIHRIHLALRNKKTNEPIKAAKVTLLNTNAQMYDITSPYSAFEDPEAYNKAQEEKNKSGNSSGSGGGGGKKATTGYKLGAGGVKGNINNNPNAGINNNAALYSIYDRFSNKGGGVDFAFKSSGTEFTFLVTAPDNTEYVMTSKNISGNTESEFWKTTQVQVEPGRAVTGTVKLGQVAIESARVRVDLNTSKEVPENETFTNKNGAFTLHNVPLADFSHSVKFTASKSGYVGDVVIDGDVKYIKTNIGGSTSSVGYKSFIDNNTISFALSIYNDINLSKLLGFPIEITELKENSGKKSVTISGIIPVESIRDNEVFTSKTKKAFKFALLEVVPDAAKDETGKPFAKPNTLPVVTELNNWDVTVNGFVATMRDEKGLKLDAVKDGDGALKGKIDLSINSFQSTSFKTAADQKLCLVDFSGNKANMLIPAFTSSGKSVYDSKTSFGIGNKDGGNVKYTLYGFNAEADANTSTLGKNELILSTLLHTKLKNVSNPDLGLLLGKVTITTKEVKPPTDNKGFDITLDKFKLTATKLTITNGSIKFDGNLIAGGLTLPFKDATLAPESFMIPDKSLKVEDVKLLGVKPIKINVPASFGYDAAKKAWSVSMLSNGKAGEIKDLDGLAQGASIPLSSIYLYSDGTNKYNLMKDPGTYTIFNTASFTPSSILVYNNNFEIPGVFDFGIPNFPTYTSSLQYDKVNDKLSGLKLGEFAMPEVKMNGVTIYFKDKKSTAIQMSQNQIVMSGTIEDKDPNVFKGLQYTLTKKNGATELALIESLKQKMPLGGTGSKMMVSDIKGKMSVVDGKWNYFYIEGDMPTEMGFKPDDRHMRFEVKGDLEVKNQSIGVSDINTPFGNLNMQYDIANARLTGNLQMEQEVSPGTSLSGAAHMVMDKKGFYFLAGAKLKMTNPNMDGSAAMLIGTYPEKDAQAAKIFQQNSKYFEIFHTLPAGYTATPDIYGIFFEGSAAVPVPVIPQFDVNVGLVSAALWVKVGGDARLGLNFSKKNTVNMGYACFVDAGFKLGASAVVACAGIKISTLVALDLDGTYSSPSDWIVSATGQITLSGNTWYGAGLYCDSDCDGLCVSDDLSASKTLGIKGTVTPSVVDYEFYFQ